MKKILLSTLVAVITFTTAKSQTQKDWYIIGGQLSDLSLNFQEGNTQFALNLMPRVAWFVKDNFAVGGEVLIGLNTAKGYTQFNYGIGPIARYYLPQRDLTITSKTRFFLDANAGIYGQNVKTTGNPSTSTNGLGLGIGPGLAYFINQNIALETLLKYKVNVGFGNSTTNNNIGLSIGFQIHLPKRKLRSLKNEIR